MTSEVKKRPSHGWQRSQWVRELACSKRLYYTSQVKYIFYLSWVPQIKLTDPPGRTRSLGKQQLELSTHTWWGRPQCLPQCSPRFRLGKHWGSRGNKTHCFPRGWPLSALIICTIPHNNLLKSSLTLLRVMLWKLFLVSVPWSRPMSNAWGRWWARELVE